MSLVNAAHIILGSPTEYGYELPKIRHALSREFYPAATTSLLDFGSGNGSNTVLFTQDFDKVVGVEVEPARYQEAIHHQRTHAVSNLDYQLYDGKTLPFPDNSFDCVVSFEVLEHTHDDQAAIAEIYRVLKPAGRAIITVPNKWYLMETHGMNFPFPNLIPWNRIPFLSWLPESIHAKYANARIYTKSAILHKFTATNFTIRHHRYLMPPFDKVSKPGLQKFLRQLFAIIDTSVFQFIGVAHFIVAEKGNR